MSGGRWAWEKGGVRLQMCFSSKAHHLTRPCVKVSGVDLSGLFMGPGRVLGGHMKFLGMGVPELLIILVVILLIFGPKNLPKLGSALGKTVKNLREGMADNKKDDEEVEELEEDDEEAEKPAPKKTTAARKKSE
ncbi:twin-arginine translocase TatA/TatE family subunit [Senegalimassilia faecalis]|uniref:Sec-independent protein translocase protein TatA n=2 Tax=Senegalimassilia faecalis TaxID=2509433 RepID=A0A4V1QTY8_9ACTN|nr:twin-arginine translocase TatA/TatE family subunit [Senegalimassilia faecalis]